MSNDNNKQRAGVQTLKKTDLGVSELLRAKHNTPVLSGVTETVVHTGERKVYHPSMD